MDVYVSRSSVAAGDDAEAPHSRTFAFPDGTTLEEIVTRIVRSGYLPLISGGKATWSVASNVPLAVVAQQWPAPRMLPRLDDDLTDLDSQKGCLRLYFNYHEQLDPEGVYKVFWGLRLNAV